MRVGGLSLPQHPILHSNPPHNTSCRKSAHSATSHNAFVSTPQHPILHSISFNNTAYSIPVTGRHPTMPSVSLHNTSYCIPIQPAVPLILRSISFRNTSYCLPITPRHIAVQTTLQHLILHSGRLNAPHCILLHSASPHLTFQSTTQHLCISALRNTSYCIPVHSLRGIPRCIQLHSTKPHTPAGAEASSEALGLGLEVGRRRGGQARPLLSGGGGGGQGGFLVRSLVDGAGSYSVAHGAGLLPTELTGMWGWFRLRSPHQGMGSPPAPAPTKQRPGAGT